MRIYFARADMEIFRRKMMSTVKNLITRKGDAGVTPADVVHAGGDYWHGGACAMCSFPDGSWGYFLGRGDDTRLVAVETEGDD
jgi:hypothetical protein